MVKWSDGLEYVGGRDAVEMRCVGPDLRLKLAQKCMSLCNRLEVEVNCDVVRVVDLVANLDCLDAAFGPEVVERTEGFEPELEVVDGVFDVK